MSYEWLKNLKAGDLVIVSRYHGDILRYVVKVTKHHIMVGSVSSYAKYRIDNGSEVTSDRWARRFIKEATPEAIDTIEKKDHRDRLVRRLESVGWHKVPT